MLEERKEGREHSLSFVVAFLKYLEYLAIVSQDVDSSSPASPAYITTTTSAVSYLLLHPADRSSELLSSDGFKHPLFTWSFLAHSNEDEFSNKPLNKQA